jgi:hypothetical protein
MYPLSCIDIRNFLNQFYFFADNHFQHPNVIDETLKKVLYFKPCSLTILIFSRHWTTYSAKKSAKSLLKD